MNYYDSIAFYMGSNSFYIDSKSEGLSSKKFSQVEGVEGSLQRITQGSEFGNCLRCADNEQVLLFNSIEKQGDYYFLQAEKLGQINDELIDFGLSGEFASNKIEFAISAKNKVVKGPVSYIQKIGNRYLVSWDFQSSIQFLNFSGENELAIAFNSDFFPNRKGFSPRDQRITDHQDFTAKSTEWNNDVSFGPIYRVPESENYFRLVKGKTSHRSKLDGGIFIVIFDSEFNFLAEKLINADTPEMGLEYFVLKSGIYIKRVTDSEDLLRYYRLIF
ncbi:DUF4221 family protein [Algoriphagus aquimarinus]|uniref:DUF4221 family protein n=1 Tax=Algoriphagus aquimarinus TaxID=237018 RepID=UPI0015875AB5|nr:DUF4221 family protein [Algoriphagus aquimarinus]